MRSTFHTLQTSRTSLLAHQKGISVIGHNIANQANEDYTRQRIKLGTLNPVDVPGLTSGAGAGQIGQGVEVKLIERIRDAFVDDKIFSQQGLTNYWQIKEFYLKNIESVYNEPNGYSIKTLFDDFLSKWNTLAQDPTERAAREELAQVSKELTMGINHIYEKLNQFRVFADGQIKDGVDTINESIKEIADLNRKIELVFADGQNPNDLMDKRDALIEDISQLADVNVIRKERDFLVFVGSQILVQGDIYRELKVVGNPNNENHYDIKWAHNDKEVMINDGQLKGLLNVRDIDIVNQIESLDNFAVNLATTINDIHREGFGLNGQTGVDFLSFRRLSLNLNGDYDSDTDGVADSTAIMKVSGTKTMKLSNKIGIRGAISLGYSSGELRGLDAELERLANSTNPMDIARRQVLESKRDALLESETITVEYFETDTVQGVIDRINASEANVVAYLNHNGQLTIKALKNEQKNLAYSEYTHAPDFAIKHLEDTGHFLTTFAGILKEAGPQGAYDWNNPGAIQSFISNPDTGAIAVEYDVSPMTHPSSYISVSKEILNDVNNIATRMGMDNNGDGTPDTANGVGDNSIANKIISTLVSEGERNQLSDFKDKLDSDIVMIDKSNTNFKSYLDGMIHNAGKVTKEAVFESESNNIKMSFWINKRQEISGVSIDEELVTMLTYEHAYRASAKVINVVDTMIETIINRMGV